MDYSKYMSKGDSKSGGGQGGDYQKYMDYSKYMSQGASKSGGGQGGDYQNLYKTSQVSDSRSDASPVSLAAFSRPDETHATTVAASREAMDVHAAVEMVSVAKQT